VRLFDVDIDEPGAPSHDVVAVPIEGVADLKSRLE
jgi:hypothetical protein